MTKFFLVWLAFVLNIYANGDYEIKNGWNLLGAKSDINTSSFSNCDILWRFENNSWIATSPNNKLTNILNQNNITSFSTIQKGVGFWAYCKENENFEISLYKNDFTTYDDNIIFNPSFATHYENSYMKVQNRNESYIGSGIDISGLLNHNKLYTITTFVKRVGTNSDTYKLNLKVGEGDYRELNRVLVDNSDEWFLLRAYVWLSSEDVAKNIKVYVNSANHSDDFLIDLFEVKTSSYTPPTTSNDDFVKVVGNKLQTSDGTNINLKGVNLVAYNDEDPQTSDESAFKFMNYTFYNYTLEDLKTIKSMGFNSIRVALWYRLFENESTPYTYNEWGFAWLDNLIGWAKEAGLYVMLDMHAPQGGGNQGPETTRAFWEDIEYQNRFVAMWKTIAARYKHEPSIIAYDIINEPSPKSQSQYLSLLETTINNIKEVDSNHIINVELDFDGVAYNAPFILTNHTNIMYDFHFYDPWNEFTANDSVVYSQNIKELMLQNFTTLASFYQDNNVPINIGEFGQKYDTFEAKNSKDWVNDAIEIFDSFDANWFYWSFKGNEFGICENINKFCVNSDKNGLIFNQY